MNRLVLALTALVLTTACSTGNNYLVNRGEDFTDIIRIKGMAGKGAGVKIDFTQFLHLGVMWEDDVSAAGWANRSGDTWDEDSMSWGLLYGKEDVTTRGVSKYAGNYGWNGSEFMWANPENKFVDTLMIRGQIMLGLGLDLQVRTGEIIDFIGGIFVLDPSRDDE